jgi:hypothetical protein
LAAIRRQLRADLAIDTLAISLVAIAAFASVFTSSAELNTNCVSREVYEITIGKMQSGTAGVTVLEFVRDIFRVGHVIGISTVILLSVAAAASIVHDTGGSGGNIEGLASQRRGLRRVLFAGAAALLALLFVNSTLFDMPLALVPAKLENAANPLHVDLSSIKAGLMTYWGATQTLILISIYIPAAMILGARAESLALRANPGKPAADRKKWLANNDIDPSWQKQLSDTLAVLSPLLAGILSNVLTGFGKLPTP